MNVQKTSVFLALLSIFCLSIKAESPSLPAKAYAHATISFIGSATTVGLIYFASCILLFDKDPRLALCVGIFTIPCGYTAYRAGLSAYNSYKKACASKKPLQNSPKTSTLEEKPNSEEESPSLNNKVQKAIIIGNISV
ncbi:hypothetical protein H0X06_06980 [Candidatus Dependentiae bacterium]|nr:hypothetical protein [Candidatus Dependentiae bacterium]